MGLISKETYKEDVESREEYGAARKVSTVWNAPLPEFVPQYKKLSRINIVPWKIGSKNHQRVVSGKAKVGDYTYILVFFEHTNIGPGKQDVICMKDTFGKPCKICEQRWAAREAGDKKLEESLVSKKRAVYVVQDLNSDDPQELRAFKTSFPLFTKELDGEAGACVDGAPVISYADELLEGKVIAFRAEEEKFGKGSYAKFKSFKFIDREPEESVTMEAINSAPSLDVFLKPLTIEQVDKIIFGEDDEDDGAPSTPQSTPSTPSVQSQTSKSVETKKPDEVVILADDPDNDPKPTTKAVKPTGESCPHDHEFGVDCDAYPKQCTKCSVYDACNQKAATL